MVRFIEAEGVEDLAPEVRARVLAGTYDFEHCATRLDHLGPIQKADAMAAVLASSGDFSEMAELLGRRRHAVQNYVMRNRDVALFWYDERESALDAVERRAFEIARDGDKSTIRFLLSTLGADRGYTRPSGRPRREEEVGFALVEGTSPKERLQQAIEGRASGQAFVDARIERSDAG